jgi:hypothetical protein
MIEPHRSVVGQLARRTEKNLSIVIGHDEEQQRDYIEGVLGGWIRVAPISSGDLCFISPCARGTRLHPRHARPRAGHPRLGHDKEENVDGRDKPGHDVSLV